MKKLQTATLERAVKRLLAFGRKPENQPGLRPNPIQRGLQIVWGCPVELKPITGAPEGKMRLKFSNKGPAKLFVKTAHAIREFILEDHGETWFANPRLTQRRTECRPVCRAYLPGANIRKFKLFAFA